MHVKLTPLFSGFYCSTISINIYSKHDIKANYKISEKMRKTPFSKANPVNPLNDLQHFRQMLMQEACNNSGTL